MKSRNIGIIQARMGATRFPGKMLAKLGDLPVIEWVVRRMLRSKTLTQLVLATSDAVADDVLADFALRLGILVFRGSESDVLSRFVGAARMANADNIVRICADNPFIDPNEVDRLVRYFVDCHCDYACNHQDRLGSGYADGFGAEILSVATLNKIAIDAKAACHREHVTLYLWEHSNEFTLCSLAAPNELAFPELCFDVNVPADLANLEGLVNAGVDIETAASNIIRLAQMNSRA